jgi:hypothetical protein
MNDYLGQPLAIGDRVIVNKDSSRGHRGLVIGVVAAMKKRLTLHVTVPAGNWKGRVWNPTTRTMEDRRYFILRPLAEHVVKAPMWVQNASV